MKSFMVDVELTNLPLALSCKSCTCIVLENLIVLAGKINAITLSKKISLSTICTTAHLKLVGLISFNFLKIKEGNDQEMAQSEKHSIPKTGVGNHRKNGPVFARLRSAVYTNKDI